jgi:drug/metabolite transporter (DMT)-like permease
MEFTTYDVAIIPLIVALVGVLGKFGLTARWQPLAALVLGLAGGFVYVAPEDPKKAVLVGLVMGLSSIGTFSGVKNTIQKRGR